MVKRIVLLLMPLVCLAAPLGARDVAQLEIGFGYANWAADVSPAGDMPDRVHGFAMHTDYNLTSWLAIDNYLGAYSFPEFNDTLNFTAVYNVFGVKLTARDVLDGAMSPYLVAGFGGGSVSDQGVGIGSSAARYGGGVDINLNPGFALRIDATNLAVGERLVFTGAGVGVDSSWSSSFNIASSIIFSLGF
jgi:hypothetical protein